MHTNDSSIAELNSISPSISGPPTVLVKGSGANVDFSDVAADGTCRSIMVNVGQNLKPACESSCTIDKCFTRETLNKHSRTAKLNGSLGQERNTEGQWF